ncbi:etoposide-induced protein 2.4-domain-containing protein [Gaertneriomyces semiglobifer]|nr:etoposide-induced protein 2.4-domain-containing protein [Gaertneriomyces semiglobifer]
MSILVVLSAVFQGIKDASQWPTAFLTLYGSKTIRTQVLKCLLLNGVLFLGSMFLFDHLLFPLSQRLFTKKHNHTNISTTTAIPTLLSTLYYLLWIYPIYTISFIVNTVYYNTIAKRAYELHHVQTPKSKSHTTTMNTNRNTTLTTLLSTEIYRSLLITNLLLLSTVVYFVPIVGPMISFVMACWVLAFYSFEYRWMMVGKGLEERVEMLECGWAYYFGFGVPCTLVTFFFPQLTSQGLFALLFPMYVIMATTARPVSFSNTTNKNNKTNTNDKLTNVKSENITSRIQSSTWVPARVPIFGIPKTVNRWMIQRVLGGSSTPPKSTTPTPTKPTTATTSTSSSSRDKRT